MLRQGLVFLCVLAFGSALASPTFARTSVVAQRSIKHAGTIFLRHGLAPGHAYRLEVQSSGHRRFAGNAVENFVYVLNNALHTTSRPVRLSGITPYAMTIDQLSTGRVIGWILAVSVQSSDRHGLTIRVVDLGRKK